MNFATLDTSAQSTEMATSYPVDVESVVQEMQQSEDTLKRSANLNPANEVNAELFNDLMGWFNEIEGNIYDQTADGTTYINFEIEDIPYSVLRRAGGTEIPLMIKNKRKWDLTQFANIPDNNEIQRGVKLAFCNPDKKPTKDEQKRLSFWTQKIFSQCFFGPGNSAPSFSDFMVGAYDCFLDLDDITREVRTNGLNQPLGMHIMDPVLYKPVIKKRKFDYRIYNENNQVEEALAAFTKDYELMLTGDPIAKEIIKQKEADYVLVYQNNEIGGFTSDQIKKHHFFKRTDMRKALRGHSAIAQGLTIITYLIDSLKYNASNFNNNRTPHGMLLFTGGGIGAMQLAKFKKILYAHNSGARNHNRFPAISSNSEKGDGKWINFGHPIKDMQYHEWITLAATIFLWTCRNGSKRNWARCSCRCC